MSTLQMSTLEDRQSQDREWLLQMLVSGMNSPLDGDLCR